MVHAIWKKIEKQTIDPVYLLTGVEHHIFDETIERLKKALAISEEDAVIRFDLTESPIEQVIEEADTLPFLEDHKLVIATNAVFLTGKEKKRHDVEHDIIQFDQWLDSPSPTATVVIIAPFESLDGRKKITKKIRQVATVIEANKLEGRDLLTWVQHTATGYGIHMPIEMAQVLVDRAGDNLLMLSTEIGKIATYLNHTGEVTREVVELLVLRTPEMDVFALTDQYIKGNVAGTVQIYHDLLQNGEEPIMLTSLIATQIRLMIHVQTLRRKGYQQQQIAKILSVHPYRVKLMLENRQLPSEQRLQDILHKLATIDFQLKSTSGNRARLLELFFMNPLKQSNH